MGKGDMKSKRGKIHRGSYGKNRLRKADKKAVAVITVAEKSKAPKAKEKPVKPVDAVVTEEPKAKKEPAKSKAKKESTDQANLFDQSKES